MATTAGLRDFLGQQEVKCVLGPQTAQTAADSLRKQQFDLCGLAAEPKTMRHVSHIVEGASRPWTRQCQFLRL